MRRLIIMRHAKAAAAEASDGDFDRPLTAGGWADAVLVAKALAGAGLTPDLALVSPARRTRQTWEAAATVFPPARVVENSRLYNAPETVLRRAYADLDDVCDTLLLIGHNPGIHALAAQLLTEAGGPSRVVSRVQNGFPPASALAFSIDQTGQPHYGGLFLARDLGGIGD